MRVWVCAIAKNEHLYINDWVKHYVKLGVDTICLYDNDDISSPHIADYIDKDLRNKVKIIDIRGRKEHHLQHRVYTEFYRENREQFDWCLFVDIDEYLWGVSNIKNWLSNPKYKNAFQIRIKWKLFGDDDLITRDMSLPVFKAFTHEIKQSLNRNLIDKGNLEKQGKMVVRGGLGNVLIASPHFASFGKRDNVIPSILPSGKKCVSKVAIREDYSNENIFVYHYMTKSLDEFINQKLNRTDAVYEDISISLDYYWRINKKTVEKIQFLEKRGLL